MARLPAARSCLIRWTSSAGLKPRLRLSIPTASGRFASLRWTGASISRSDEHTSELQSLMRLSCAVYCLQNKSIKHAGQEAAILQVSNNDMKSEEQTYAL